VSHRRAKKSLAVVVVMLRLPRSPFLKHHMPDLAQCGVMPQKM
jgi:hypothetical protein